MAHATPETLSLKLPSRLELLAVLDRVVLAVCERMAFSEEATAAVSMAVLEAGTNAVQHAHQRDASRLFEVEFVLHADRLEVLVHDSGPGFDPVAVTHDITTPEHLLDMRGRGLYIMRASCDEVEFTFTGHGTRCRLVKHRVPAPGAVGA